MKTFIRRSFKKDTTGGSGGVAGGLGLADAMDK